MHKNLTGECSEAENTKKLKNEMEAYKNSYISEHGHRMGLQHAYDELLSSCDMVVKGKFGLLVSYGISIAAIVLSIIKLLR